MNKRLEVSLSVGDKITINTPYGEMFISIPFDDYNWNEQYIRLSAEKKIAIIPCVSNSLELKLIGGNEVLNCIKLEGRDWEWKEY